jgi:catechol 2,3-dioxygenase-like lactoylglutathione lyase family enzyme
MLSNLQVQAVLPVIDLQRARDYYEGVLGLVPAAVLPAGTFYECGNDSRMAISHNGALPDGDHTQVTFLTDQIESEVAALRGRGVVFEEYADGPMPTVDGIARRGPVTAAWFKDSEGNLLGLLHLETAPVAQV